VKSRCYVNYYGGDAARGATIIPMIPQKALPFFVMMILIAPCFAAEAWVVRQDGVGPVRVGMRLSQLNVALHEKFVMPESNEDQGCFYVTPAKHPQVSFMIEKRRLVRIDVDKSGVATTECVQVGDSEEHVKKVYGSRLKVEPHHYTEGHYLTLRNGNYGIRFETDKGKVSTFYAGTFDAIQYIEGCQ
jgi:hypothetical protein